MSSSVASVRARLEAALGVHPPLTDLGRASLEAFLALPGIEGWALGEELYAGRVAQALHTGLPLALLGANASAASHRKAIAEQVLSREPSWISATSEVEVGALLSHWGGTPRFVPREVGARTPDLECIWHGALLAVEVTTAKSKVGQKDVQKAIETLSDAMFEGARSCHLVAYFADASDKAAMNSLVSAAADLEPGSSAGDVGWSVTAVPMDRRDDIVGADCDRHFAPTWWKGGEPTLFANSTTVGGPTSPVLALRSQIPVATNYANSILNKADRGQRREGEPFLIALDVGQLPRAHTRLVADLQSIFSTRDYLSGVLLFESLRWALARHMSWIVSLHSNPYANEPLPPQLAAALKTGDPMLTIDFPLMQSSRDSAAK